MAEGFLSRWSQRKQAVRAGQPVAEIIKQNKAIALENSGLAATTSISKVRPDAATAHASEPASERLGAAPPDPTPNGPPAPTLDDVQALQPSDSFARFVARDVSPDVRNAAMKKLFTDPHYNLMDGLDIYISDYSIPSPLPEATLRQMVSAKFLNLFEEDPPTGEDAHTAPASFVAQSATAPDLPHTHAASVLEHPAIPLLDVSEISKELIHDHTDLRLQPDHAAGPAALERQPEPSPDVAQQPVPPPSR